MSDYSDKQKSYIAEFIEEMQNQGIDVMMEIKKDLEHGGNRFNDPREFDDETPFSIKKKPMLNNSVR
jgi:hypothetical protein